MAVVTVLAAVVMAFDVANRQSAISRVQVTSEPLLVQAQTAFTTLSDADTTAAGGFLAGTVAPAAAQDRYRQDLALAAQSVAAVQSGAAGREAARTLAVDLPVYTGLVAAASANQRRLGYPVAASYLGEASNLLRTGMLPAASSVYRQAQQRVSDDRSAASSSIPVVVAGLLLAVALIGLVRLQAHMADRFRRTINVPIAAGTVAILVAGIWLAVALIAQSGHVSRAGSRGTTLLSRYTAARLLVLQARADDELTLVTRDSVSSYQVDYAKLIPRITAATDPTQGTTGDDIAHLRAVTAALRTYQAAHQVIRNDDAAGNLTGAIAVASGGAPSDLPAASAAIDAALTAGITQAQSAFDNQAAAAAADLTGLTVGLVVLGAVAAILVVGGAQRRIAEYA